MPRGAVLTLEQTWTMAQLWYRDRLDPKWRRRTVQETNDAFASIGLTGDFWQLP